MRIALATCQELPELDADDHAYVAALRARGATVTLPIWDDQHASWDADVVVVRSTWDYSERRDAFVAWAATVDAQTPLFLNPSAMIRWNTDKQLYLTDLSEQGIATVPTAWLAKDGAKESAHVDVAALVALRGWRDVVIKPVVGAGSRDTIRVLHNDLATVGQRFVQEQTKKQALMVQPFLPRIADGEVSLIFLDGSYSHSVIKRPRSGDFRSQPEFGSQIDRHSPTSTERSLADRALHIAGGRPLYARVDLVTGLDDQPAVIELEMVEPCLYLGWSDDAAAVFADATLRRANERR